MHWGSEKISYPDDVLLPFICALAVWGWKSVETEGCHLMDDTQVMKIIHDQTGVLFYVNENNSKCE